jgi:hypothetical protein
MGLSPIGTPIGIETIGEEIVILSSPGIMISSSKMLNGSTNGPPNKMSSS